MRTLFKLICVSLVLIPRLCLTITPWLQPSSTISTPGVDATAPSVAIDLNGNAVVVWVENNAIVSTSNPFSGSWSLPIVTLSNPANLASNPQVVIDQAGTATAVWIENQDVKTSTLLLGGQWSSAVMLSQNQQQVTGVAQMCIDTMGNIVVVWEENGYIHSATQLVNGSWPQSPDTLSSKGASVPNVSIGENGTVVAVWMQSDFSIHAASKMINGSWGSSQQISSLNVNCNYPVISVDTAGNAAACWYSYNVSNGVYSNVFVQGATQLVGMSWGTPVNISKAGIVSPDRLKLSVKSYTPGTALALWTNSYNGSLFSLEWSQLQNESWGTSVLALAPTLTTYQMSQDVNFFNTSYMSAMYLDGSNVALLGFMLDMRGVTNSLREIWYLSTGGNNGFPNIAVNKVGSVPYGICGWENDSGSNITIQVLTTQFPVIQPPTNLAVVQQSNNYEVCVLYDNVLTWSPSSSPNIISYFVFRNGLWVVRVDAPGPYTYTDYNRLPNEQVTYSIYSMNKYGIISSLATYTVN